MKSNITESELRKIIKNVLSEAPESEVANAAKLVAGYFTNALDHHMGDDFQHDFADYLEEAFDDNDMQVDNVEHDADVVAKLAAEHIFKSSEFRNWLKGAIVSAFNRML